MYSIIGENKEGKGKAIQDQCAQEMKARPEGLRGWPTADEHISGPNGTRVGNFMNPFTLWYP